MLDAASYQFRGDGLVLRLAIPVVSGHLTYRTGVTAFGQPLLPVGHMGAGGVQICDFAVRRSFC